jgi:hypothetical protein
MTLRLHGALCAVLSNKNSAPNRHTTVHTLTSQNRYASTTRKFHVQASDDEFAIPALERLDADRQASPFLHLS